MVNADVEKQPFIYIKNNKIIYNHNGKKEKISL
jgi:hypothetical protein